MAKVSVHPDTRKLLDLLARDQLEAHSIGLALAGLIYLRWADFYESEQEAIAAFDDTDYQPVLPASFHWRSWQSLPPNALRELFVHRLLGILEALGNSRHDSLATHLHRVGPAVEKLGALSPQSLQALIDWLAEQAFETPSDRRALLEIFDSILGRLIGRYSGSYRTPTAVAELLIQAAAPRAGDRVYDPCFGYAGLLTGACDYVMRNEKDRFGRDGAPPVTLFGVEYNAHSYVIGLARLALAGIDDPHLELGNSLERVPPSNPQKDGFDVILANPPWGMRADSAGLDHYPVRTSDVTALFIQHALSQLRPGGRSAIVVPQGILFRKELQHLRRMLLDQHTVEAVVALPSGAFAPYSGVAANVLVLEREGRTQRIRMADTEALFERGKGRQSSTIRPELVEQFGEKLRASKPAEYCWDVDVEALAKTEWDLTPRRRDQSGLIPLLDSLRNELGVVPLSQCCEILSGRSIKSEELLATPPPAPPVRPEQSMLFQEQGRETQQSMRFDMPLIPYVRIKDLSRGRADRGSQWLSPAAASSVNAQWKLRAGDVLISKSGTIGKVGVVRNGAVGGVAASGLFVLRPDPNRLDPHFLMSYLQSSECRALLDDMASGSTIRHLSRRTLYELPIPLPPLPLQHHVAKQHRDHGVDSLAFLVELLTEGERDPVSEWVDNAIEALPNTDSGNDPLDLAYLDRLATEVRAVCNQVAHGDKGSSPLGEWILQFSEALFPMRGVRSIPPGPGLLSVLRESRHRVRETITAIKGYLPTEEKARNLVHLLAERLDSASSALLNNVRVLLRIEEDVLQAREVTEISFYVHNKGPLPLREVRITTSPDWGHHKFDYLAENQKNTVHLSGIGPKVTGVFTITVNWTASTLDGQQFEGSREIPLKVVEEVLPFDHTVELGASPYVCGDPVRPERNDVFFGREELLQQIQRQVLQSGNVVLLEGNRRSGKSSILWHLEGPNAIPGWLGAYCSLQGAEGGAGRIGVPTVEIFREISKSMARSLHTLGGETPLPDGTILPPDKKLGIAKACRQGISEEGAFSDLRDYLEIVLEMLSERNLGLLLMLDEFDKLQEGIDHGITSPQVPENIRFLTQTYQRFSVILTGSRRLKRLREEYWSALFGLGTRFGVTALSEDAARRLVTQPVDGRLIYSNEAIEHAVSLTARQPYLLQCLCNRVFDLAAQLKTRSVGLDLVKQAGDALVEDNEHCASLWDYAGTNRRRFILALCHKESCSPDPFTLGVFLEKLSYHGIELDEEHLGADLEFLRELELIDLVGEAGGGHYVLTIPLMGMWIERQQDFAVLESKARSETEDEDE